MFVYTIDNIIFFGILGIGMLATFVAVICIAISNIMDKISSYFRKGKEDEGN